MARRGRHRRADTGGAGLSEPPGAVPDGVADLVTGSAVLLSPAMDVLRRLPDDAVDLIYVDPPFGTGQTRRLR